MTTNQHPLLQLKNLTVSYGEHLALQDISMIFKEGTLTTILGSNGAGKTTLLKTIAGLLSPHKGSISYFGNALTSVKIHDRVKQGIILVPEGRGMLSSMSVLENLEMGAYTRSDTAVQKDIASMMERFPILGERRQQLAGTLSGGQQQLLAIARALLANPKLLLLDEPSLGLAPLVVEEILQTIVDVHKEGTTVILVEQNAMKALQIAQYAYVLETGSIVIEGEAEKLLHDPKVKEAYLGG